jgi:hemolysin type calcium-binding protein
MGWRPLVCIAVAVLPCLLGPAPAAGSTVEGYSSGVSFRADPGEANRLAVSIEGDGINVVDQGSVIQPGSGCEPRGEHAAFCPGSLPRSVGADLGDGDDSATVDGGPGSLLGGPGDDRLVGQDEEMEPERCPVGMVCAEASDPCPWTPGRNDELQGGPGDDVLEGRGGWDVMTGGDGRDRLDGGGGCDQVMGDQGSYAGWILGQDETLRALNAEPGGGDVVQGGAGDDAVAGGPGGDVLDGGSGRDRLDPGLGDDVVSGGAGSHDNVYYLLRTGPVAASLDGLANDGEPGERDLILDAEGLIGGSGDDVLVGDSRSTPNPVAGGFGGGNDLEGRSGDDVLVGFGGYHDLLMGGNGNDRIHALDGEPEGSGAVLDIPGMNGFLWDDRVECDGYGTPWEPAQPGDADLALVDPGDASIPGAVRGCELALRAETPVTIRGGDTTVPVSAICPAGLPTTTCLGDVEIRLPSPPIVGTRSGKPRIPAIDSSWHKLAAAKFKARSARARTVPVKLSSKARKLVRKRSKVRAYVVFRFRKK